jgi:hypothetical protein
LQDYRAILERQGNACAICKMPAKPLCVDHCHATGKVRGFLCRNCNLGLGNYNDNPDLHRAGAAYLEAARRDDSPPDAPHQDQGGNGANAASGTLAGGAGGEIFRESPRKFMASRMSAASLQSDLPLNRTGVSPVPTNRRPAIRPVADFSNPIQEEITMTKIVLALVLAIAAFATVPAAAGPYCQEDLGYGRTSSFGCGG